MNNDFVIPILVALIAAGIPSLIMWLAGRNKSGVDASASAAVAIKSYSDEVIKLRAELVDMRRDMDTLRLERDVQSRKMAEWEVGIKQLIGQLVSRRDVPVWTPEGSTTP